ncbi:lITAF domain-containing protein [Paramormyrops kingsleyae]|uniref:Si:ch211-157c3.4 n=1 Tax=Paramormyrops kingsleyae TaxID=1676925 RepID=A0A3B3TGJ3_9TELE|nr:lipopolysaccharide-induced tumor necrosis factor-alpha factor homolog [Paramormyrops kingsleyae]XP_023677542.1 lipopolysaccharide-induced tumor necrosis factor-alpha factor homolog [Paramormyrops kingsleyae]
MSASANGDPGTIPPPYVISVGETDDVKVYHPHTPFTPPESTPYRNVQPESKNKFVSYETELSRSPGMTTCINCQQQVMTEVTYKVGAYAWLMCLLFILCGLVIGCCLLPFFMKFFKDVYHSCPKCHQIINVQKKKCC